MLSASVKSQLARAFPTAVLNDSYGASETGAAGSEVGASTERDRPAFATDGRTWVLDPETLEPLEPGSGVEGLFARKGHIPLGYWKDPAKTAATFRTDDEGVRWVVPGDWATIDAEGRIVLVRPRLGLHQLRWREDLPRRGRGRRPRASRRLRRSRRRRSRRALRPEGRRPREAARRGRRSVARRRSRSTAGRRSRATRCRACCSSATRPAPTRTSPTTPPRRRSPARAWGRRRVPASDIAATRAPCWTHAHSFHRWPFGVRRRLGLQQLRWPHRRSRDEQVVDAALEHGITLFDTADIYGGTRSEEFLGRALAGRRDRALIATKFGGPIDASAPVGRAPRTSPVPATIPCAGSAPTGSTSISSTSPTRRPRSRRRSARSTRWCARARCARSAAATSPRR